MRGIEELKRIKDRRPFEPFFIHLADGRQLRIVHPDNVAWNPGEVVRHIYVGYEDGFEIVDPALITGLRTPRPTEAAPSPSS